MMHVTPIQNDLVVDGRSYQVDDYIKNLFLKDTPLRDELLEIRWH